MTKRAVTKYEKILLALTLGYFVFMAGALLVLAPLQNGQQYGNRIGAFFTANAMRSIGELHRAPSSETALRALHALQITVTSYQHSDGYALSSEEGAMLYDMKLLLAKKLVTPPSENCIDAVECYQMGAPGLALPASVVEDVRKAFENSKVLVDTASAHGTLLSAISNAPAVYTYKVLSALCLGFAGILVAAAVFLFGLQLGRKTEQKGDSTEEKSSSEK